MEWTPGPREASRLMRVLHRKDVHNLSTLTKPDSTSTRPGEETADLLFQTHFPQSTPLHLPHYDHASSPTAVIMEHLLDIVIEDSIRESISHFQAKKTPGPDGFKPVLLLHLPPQCPWCIVRHLPIVSVPPLYPPSVEGVHSHFPSEAWKDDIFPPFFLPPDLTL